MTKRTWMMWLVMLAVGWSTPMAQCAEELVKPAKAKPVDKAKERDAEVRAITEQLASGDAQKVEAAIASIWQMFAKNPGTAAGYGMTRWSQPLVLAKRYDDLAALCLTGTTVVAGNISTLETLQQQRIRALIGAGRGEEALAAAKSLYNVCRMGATSGAIDLVSKALVAARPNDPSIGKKFRLEQAAGASTNAPSEASKEPALLTTVKVDPAPYKTAIDTFLRAEGFKPATLCALGNLYLMADQPKPAEERFRQAIEWGAKGSELVNATEGIARCLRAQDGTVRRANAWIIEQRNNQ